MESITREVHLSDGNLNTPLEEIEENIRTNIKRDLPQIMRYEDNPHRVIALVGGGPSLDDTKDDLKKLLKEGATVVATNGSAKWLDDNGIRYHAHVLLDAREFNQRFVREPKEDVRYFVCSQCHPKVFENLEGFDVHIWHGGTAKFITAELDEVYGAGKYIIVKTGRTVMLGSLYLFRCLGFSKFELFGFDSSMKSVNEHHAYEQPENDYKCAAELRLNGRTFFAQPWMIGQAQDFLKFSRVLGRKYDINIHGDGLIAHMMQTIADTGELEFEKFDTDSLDHVIEQYRVA